MEDKNKENDLHSQILKVLHECQNQISYSLSCDRNLEQFKNRICNSILVNVLQSLEVLDAENEKLKKQLENLKKEISKLKTKE